MSGIEELAAKVHDPKTSYFGRIDAIRALGKLKTTQAAQVLTSALSDREQMVRQSAVQALAEIGTADTVKPLIAVLQSDDDSLHHYAVEALGKIGAAEARPVLEQIAKNGSFMVRSAAQRALEKLPAAGAAPVAAGAPTPPPIASRPAPPIASRPAASSPMSPPPMMPGAPPAPPSAPIDATFVARLIQQALQGVNCQVTPEQNGARYKLTVPLAEGRHQDVYIATGIADSEGSPLMCVYTYCAPATPENYERALRYNMRMSYGALAINDVGDTPMFVMVDTVLISAADANEVRKTILGLARHGDRVEKSLTGKDLH
ncbi:MAG: hypothetical protein GC159_06380 [Phycisphaera sp.]|nr:hypothetical protein [Phycisphaera sp.]